MLDYRIRHIAERYEFVERIENFQSNLLLIEGVEDVEFDLTGFPDAIPYVILLLKYNIAVALEEFYERRKALVSSVLRVAADHGMTRTEDRIEDYGEHLYIVCRLDETCYNSAVRSRAE